MTTVHRAVIHEPRQQTAGIAGTDWPALRAPHPCPSKLKLQRWRNKRKVFAIRRKFADDQCAVVLQIGQLCELVDIRTGGQAACDDFDGRAE